MKADTRYASKQRVHPRVAIESFCTALGDEPETHAIALDLSPRGLRLQRPLGGRMPRQVQLELEIPGVDELLWAVGEVRYDRIYRTPRSPGRQRQAIVRSCGIYIVAAASYHRRLLREYVMDTFRSLGEPCRASSTELARA